MRKYLAMSALPLIFASGCASIVSDSQYDVRVNSDPASAYTITNQNGLEVAGGRTPDVVSLAASRGFFSGAMYTMTFEADGYDKKTVQLLSSVDGWVVGNLLFGGPIGLVIDGATGSMFKLESLASQRLDRTQSAQADTDLTIVFFDYDSLSEEQRNSLTPIY